MPPVVLRECMPSAAVPQEQEEKAGPGREAGAPSVSLQHSALTKSYAVPAGKGEILRLSL